MLLNSQATKILYFPMGESWELMGGGRVCQEIEVSSIRVNSKRSPLRITLLPYHLAPWQQVSRRYENLLISDILVTFIVNLAYTTVEATKTFMIVWSVGCFLFDDALPCWIYWPYEVSLLKFPSQLVLTESFFGFWRALFLSNSQGEPGPER